MKYSQGKIKREHGVLPEFETILKKIAAISSVQRVIPGRIKRSQGSSSHFFLSISYPTDSGIKCIMKKGGTAQELFLTGDSGGIVQGLRETIDAAILRHS